MIEILLADISEQIVTLTFDRPQVCNVMDNDSMIVLKGNMEAILENNRALDYHAPYRQMSKNMNPTLPENNAWPT